MQIKHAISLRSLLIAIMMVALFNVSTYEAQAKKSKARVASVKSSSKKGSKSKSKTKLASKKSKKKSRGSSERRSYNPTATRAQALETLRASDELAELAGIESAELNESKATKNASVMANEVIAANSASANISQNQNDQIGDEGEDIEELEREDDVIIDIDQFRMFWLAYVSDTPQESITRGGFKKSDIMAAIMDWLGTPYHFGGHGESGIDCSAFVRTVYGTVADGAMLPRTAASQFGVGKNITKEKLEFGDLVFFHTRKNIYVGHVGIYLGDNKFAHASSRYGVTVSSLESGYYDARFIGARRIKKDDIMQITDAESNPKKAR